MSNRTTKDGSRKRFDAAVEMFRRDPDRSLRSVTNAFLAETGMRLRVQTVKKAKAAALLLDTPKPAAPAPKIQSMDDLMRSVAVSDKETDEFFAFLARNRAAVAKMPAWMRKAHGVADAGPAVPLAVVDEPRYTAPSRRPTSGEVALLLCVAFTICVAAYDVISFFRGHP